jgi:hypothetical protein
MRVKDDTLRSGQSTHPRFVIGTIGGTRRRRESSRTHRGDCGGKSSQERTTRWHWIG